VKAWKKIYQTNGPPKQAGVAILISGKVDFKPKLLRRDKKSHFILIKGMIQQEKMTIINLHEPNVGAFNFIKHTLLDSKTQLDPNTVVVGDFNTPLSPIDRSSRQKTKNLQS
jgi:hypothetical protein